MKETYYKVDDMLFRTRESDTEFFIEWWTGEKWRMKPSLVEYIFGGEPGAVQISKADADQITQFARPR